MDVPPAHLPLQTLDEDELVKFFRPRPQPVDALDLPPEPDLDDWEAVEELLFADHDALRGLGTGVYSFDQKEAASRRVDLRDETDADPGPIPLGEAPEDHDAVVLDFDEG